jgi:predicted component of type VI protein secretion system
MGENAAGGSQDGFFALARALGAFKAETLAGDPSDRVLAKAAGVSASTVGDWLRGTRFPQDLGAVLMVVRKVGALAAARSVAAPAGLLEDGLWRDAYEAEARRRAGVVSDAVQRAQAVSVLPGHPAAVRAGAADLRRLGVHEAISVPGTAAGALPEYVPRDADAARSGVRARVAAAAERGGFVLLVGGSSVGKTRCAAEAIRALVPDWQLVHPAGPAEVAALAGEPPPRTVVWLDELQRYLDGEHELTGGIVRALLGAPGPVMLIGTLWPDLYSLWTAVRTPGSADPHPREREVLGLADTVRIAPVFSPAEQDRARAAASRDPQLRAALEAGGAGLTQTLAAAPQLVARWEDAQAAHPYAWAVLTAALDAARLGARAPLTADLLRAAAPGYCTSAQQAEAPDSWFEQALAYATEKLHGAAAALTPAAAGMGEIAGYTVADYLLQHASQERRATRVPASTWDALLTDIRDPGDAVRLAGSARGRLLYRYAIPLYRQAADAGNEAAAWQLAGLLDERGDLDGAVQVLRARADAGDGYAAGRLASLLAERGDLDGLRARADAGDEYAAWRLADLLAERGDLDGLRARADAGDEAAAWRLAGLLDERDDLDGAVQVLRARADAGDEYAAGRLAGLLAVRGDLDGAVQILRARTDAGDGYAADQLAFLLRERGDLDGLRARADAGDEDAADQLAELLAQRGDLDELRARADAGDEAAADQLAGLLAQRGDLDELRARADASDGYAADQLADLLAQRGDLDGAAQVLRARADAGDGAAAAQLAFLLRERGDLDGLRARADAGDGAAAGQLARLLYERGDLDGLRARADADDDSAACWLAELRAQRGDLDELRARADAGDGYPLRRAWLLKLQGQDDEEEAERLRRYGLNPDGSIASR